MTYRFAAVLLAIFLYLPPAEALPAPQAKSVSDGPTFEVTVPPFSDTDVAKFVTDLDAHLSMRANQTDQHANAAASLADFAHRLQHGLLSPTQEIRVLDHLGEIGRSQPDGLALVASSTQVIRQLTIGKAAPDIAGTDLDGKAMRLSDFKGRVVLLTFSGDWCGICRTQYPYERLLQELYRNWPFVIVSVNSDTDTAAAKRGQTSSGLDFRSWWDGSALKGRGPIATAWSVNGWPTTYVIAADGVIRFVDLRSEDLLKAVKQLLVDTPARQRPGRLSQPS